MSAPPNSNVAHAAQASRAVWLKHLHQWHWISSALCLLGMFLFSITGITLNHASQIEAKPTITRLEATAPAALVTQLRTYAEQHDGAKEPLPAAAEAWLKDTWMVQAGGRVAEWSADEIYLAMPRAGGDAWVRIELEGGAAEYEKTDRGWISWLNDVHKGRNTGTAWNWFIDIFAVMCLVFCITGLLILKFHAAKRPFTWPMVGLGVLIPVVIALLFIH
ncbi:PepSY-associated TM helix domain-containing protein [Duganella phyllosphaerae]|uniref:PepSY-associated TM helix n=1 Tax=Duganella phyllosphaerae TaxID=762836 RepID=A0A1E7WKY5_9BURK|nr:PepSY-associated TM helix domain-containing protein [Duganella phyllosphaerae]OEZ99692.1 PepSY-associated TM helix [Duganella phyllosphaerae]